MASIRPTRSGIAGPPHVPIASAVPSAMRSATISQSAIHDITVSDCELWSLLETLALVKKVKTKRESLKALPTFSGRWVSNPIEASRPPVPAATSAVTKSSTQCQQSPTKIHYHGKRVLGRVSLLRDKRVDVASQNTNKVFVYKNVSFMKENQAKPYEKQF